MSTNIYLKGNRGSPYAMKLPPGYLGCCRVEHDVDTYDFYRTCVIARLRTLEGATTKHNVYDMAAWEWEITQYALDGDTHSIKSLRAYKAQHTRKLRAKGFTRW